MRSEAKNLVASSRPWSQRVFETELFVCQVGSLTEWSFQSFEPVFLPNAFVDISATIAAKIRAMGIYEGEVRPFPRPRSPDALRAAAAKWGSVPGLPAADAFELVRLVR